MSQIYLRDRALHKTRMVSVSSSGRPLGTVRSVVVEVDSGRSSYAVSQDRSQDGGRVLLLPRNAVDHRDDVVVIEERILQRLERRSA